MSRRPTGRNGRSTGGRQERSSRNYRSSGSQRGRSSGGSNPLPPVLGGLGLVAIIAVIALVSMKGGEEDSTPRETPKVDRTASRDSSSSVKTAASRGEEINWGAFKAKVDMKPWREIEMGMEEALTTLRDAKRARKDGDDGKHDKLAGKAVRQWRECDLLAEDWMEEVNGIKDGLFDKAFSKQSKKLQSWAKKFRGYLHLE